MNNLAFDNIKANFPETKLTLLTSERGAEIAKYLPSIDDTIILNPPWMKTHIPASSASLLKYIEILKEKKFDACIFFNVYSQNITVAALVCLMADIPIRAGYCRENPSQLLTHWVQDDEPFDFIDHQITRDLKLLYKLGLEIKLYYQPTFKNLPESKIKAAKQFQEWAKQGYVLINPEASESKRCMDVKFCRNIIDELIKRGNKIIFSGNSKSAFMNECTRGFSSEKLWCLNGELKIHDLIFLISNAQTTISVNTGTAHLACILNKPVIVIYAKTNPQHLPWNRYSDYFLYNVNPENQSKNKIIAVGLIKWQEVLPLNNSVKIIMSQFENLMKKYWLDRNNNLKDQSRFLSDNYIIPQEFNEN